MQSFGLYQVYCCQARGIADFLYLCIKHVLLKSTVWDKDLFEGIEVSVFVKGRSINFV